MEEIFNEVDTSFRPIAWNHVDNGNVELQLQSEANLRRQSTAWSEISLDEAAAQSHRNRSRLYTLASRFKNRMVQRLATPTKVTPVQSAARDEECVVNDVGAERERRRSTVLNNQDGEENRVNTTTTTKVRYCQ